MPCEIPNKLEVETMLSTRIYPNDFFILYEIDLIKTKQHMRNRKFPIIYYDISMGGIQNLRNNLICIFCQLEKAFRMVELKFISLEFKNTKKLLVFFSIRECYF